MRGRAPFLAFALLAVALRAEAAPALTLEDRAGTQADVVRLLDGEPHVLHFWATWCGPCLAELPELDSFLSANPEIAQRVIVISVDSAPFATVERFLRERVDVSLETMRVVDGNAGVAFGVVGYPTTVFVGGEGEVAERITGVVEWSAAETVERLSRHLGI